VVAEFFILVPHLSFTNNRFKKRFGDSYVVNVLRNFPRQVMNPHLPKTGIYFLSAILGVIVIVRKRNIEVASYTNVRHATDSPPIGKLHFEFDFETLVSVAVYAYDGTINI
jgi:hypothetical protein